MNENATDPIGDIELLSVWDGPAEHERGVLFGENPKLGGEHDLLELAAWVGGAAISGMVGNSVHETVKARVLAVLTGFRRRQR